MAPPVWYLTVDTTGHPWRQRPYYLHRFLALGVDGTLGRRGDGATVGAPVHHPPVTPEPPTGCRWRSVTPADRTLRSKAGIVNLAAPRTGEQPLVRPRDPHTGAHVLLLWADGIVATTSATVLAWAGRDVFLDVYARAEHWMAWIDACYVQRCDCP